MLNFLEKAVSTLLSDTSSAAEQHAILPSAATHIRLLKIYPAGYSWVPIYCKMLMTPISEPMNFQALSYTWGTAARTHSLKLPETDFRITQSLDEAIRHLRREDEAITLWIDQICINQENLQEKSLQIGLMSQIYSKAQRVLVWLGPAESGSDTMLANLGLESFYTEEKFPQLQPIVINADPADPLTIEFQALFEKGRSIYRDSLDAIIAWFQRPWFKRVWVVQEFCLCPDTVFVCGKRSVAVELVMLAIQIVHFSCGKLLKDAVGKDKEFAELNAKFPLILNEPTSALFRKSTGDSLLSLMRKLYVQNEMHATDQRDRIFALLGLATDGLDIIPDYSDFDYAGLLCRTARVMIEKQGLEVLSYSQFPKSYIPLPSWVPDWRSNLSPSYYDHTLVDPPFFQACGDTKPSVISSPSTLMLVLEGITVDVVEEVGSPWHKPLSFSHEQYLSYFAQVRLMCQLSALKNEPIYASESRRDEAVWRVPIGDLYTCNGRTTRPTSDVRGAYKSLVAECELFEQRKLAGSVSELQGQTETILDTDGSHYQCSTETMSGKRPFLTKKGHLGMGPPMMMSGDVVVILMGSRIPFVLRPGEHGNFAFTGDAYCDGVMDGELINQVRPEKFMIL
ncbi:heterokaryon incompatibility protein-domain-containing protein [Fusarium oxysporum]|nr:heterokaryon incompatibility protein-domain-containing protein [Fusarium oxysporum]